MARFGDATTSIITSLEATSLEDKPEKPRGGPNHSPAAAPAAAAATAGGAEAASPPPQPPPPPPAAGPVAAPAEASSMAASTKPLVGGESSSASASSAKPAEGLGEGYTYDHPELGWCVHLVPHDPADASPLEQVDSGVGDIRRVCVSGAFSRVCAALVKISSSEGWQLDESRT